MTKILDNLFIGAGAMKAGTTWLYSVFDRHPEIYFSFEKEIHYFYAAYVKPDVLSNKARLRNAQDKYLTFDAEKIRPQGLRDRLHWTANYLDSPVDDIWYRNLFALRTRQTYAADFSNLYALLPESGWRRVQDRVDRLRVLYTMRDPVERLWSHVKFHLRFTGKDALLDQWTPEEAEAFFRQPFIWDNAEYGRAVARMQAALPSEAIKIAWHEEIHADEIGFLRSVEGFLEISQFDYPGTLLKQKVNATAKRPIPDWFRDLLERDVERIRGELISLGLNPPASWSSGATIQIPMPQRIDPRSRTAMR